MPQTYDAQYEQQVQELAKGFLADYVEGIRKSMGTTPAGASTPSDEALAAFFFKQQKLYPPVWCTYPDGRRVFASPWILALDYCTNGTDWLGKWERFMSKAGPPMSPVTRSTGRGIETAAPDAFSPLGGVMGGE